MENVEIFEEEGRIESIYVNSKCFKAINLLAPSFELSSPTESTTTEQQIVEMGIISELKGMLQNYGPSKRFVRGAPYSNSFVYSKYQAFVRAKMAYFSNCNCSSRADSHFHSQGRSSGRLKKSPSTVYFST